MSIKEKFRRLLLIGAIGLALHTGTPMRPDEIEAMAEKTLADAAAKQAAAK